MSKSSSIYVERFKGFINSVTSNPNQAVYGIDNALVLRLNQLFNRYPEIMSESVCEAMLVLKDGPQLNSIEICKLGPLFNIALVKDYVILGDRMPEKDTYRQCLEDFAKAMGLVLQVKDIRSFMSRFMGFLEAKLTFKDSFSDSFLKGRATITMPKIKEQQQLVLSADLNVAIRSNLLANREILKSTPIERFTFNGERKHVLFKHGIINEVIKSLIQFQNSINNHNWTHGIVQPPFIKMDSGVEPTA